MSKYCEKALNLLKSVDMVGVLVGLKMEKSSKYKTYLGSVITFIIAAFGCIAIFVLGKEIWEKKEPFVSYSKTYLNKSEVEVKHFPIILAIGDPLGRPIPKLYENYVSLYAFYYEFRGSKDGVIDLRSEEIPIEKCDPNTHFGRHKDILTDPSSGIPLGMTYCLSPNFIEGNTKIPTNISFFNPYGNPKSSFISIFVSKCKTRTGKYCREDELYPDTIPEFYANLYYVDYYIDPTDLATPQKKMVGNYLQQIGSNMAKRNYFRIKNTRITTDVGWLFSDKYDIYINQLDSIKTDSYISKHTYYILSFESPSLRDNHFRVYMKLPDLLAKISGFVKALFIIGTLLNSFFSYNSYMMDLMNRLFLFPSTDEEDCVQKISKFPTSNNTSNIILVNSKEILSKLEKNNFEEKFNQCEIPLFWMACCKKGNRNWRRKEEFKKMKVHLENMIELPSVLKRNKEVEYMLNILFSSKNAKTAFDSKYVLELFQDSMKTDEKLESKKIQALLRLKENFQEFS